MSKTKNTYDSSSIKKLDYPECVRKRPSMYIGALEYEGIFHLIKEAVDNSVDEYLAGHASNLSVTVDYSSNAIAISDNGRGIPFDNEEKFHSIFCSLHSGK